MSDEIKVKTENTRIFSSVVGIKTYNSLVGKPKINGVELEGDKSTADLKIEVDTSKFATKDELNSKADKTEIPDISGLATKEEIPDVSEFAATKDLEQKQDKLVSGTNIKTINGQSILGSGNIIVEGGGSSNAVSNPLTGKTILAIGDSFVKGHTLSESKTWVAKIAERNNMTYKIAATNGITVAYKSGQSATPIVNTIDATIAANESPDYVLFLAGHNDANPSLNGGTAIAIGSNSDNVNTTFKGALNIIINKLMTAYPTAKILFLTPFLRRDIEEPYAEAMKEICGIHKVPCFDNYHSSGINFKNASQSSVYELNSSLHLNELGLERISYVYESLLKNECSTNYSTPSTSKSVDLSGFVTTEQLPFSVVSMTKEEFDGLEVKLSKTLYFVQGYGVYLGTTCIISTDNQPGTGTEEAGGSSGDDSGGSGDDSGSGGITGGFVEFTDGVMASSGGSTNNRVIYTVVIPANAMVDFKDSSYWNTYKYAIAEGSGGLVSPWIGGGYQTGAYTTTTDSTYTVMVARQDNATMKLEESNGIIGYTVQ